MAPEQKNPEYVEVELPAIKQLKQQDYTYISGADLSPDSPNKERISYRDVVLINRLKKSLQKINPDIAEENIAKVIHDITHIPVSSCIEANQKIWEMIVRYVSVQQDMGKGKKGQTVKIIDFDTIENNEFIVTNQFKIHGLNENIIPDIIVFINGLPIAVIECKAPNITDPITTGIEQLLRYSNQRHPETHEGAERLFHYNQLVVSTCFNQARIATLGARYEHYMEWKDPYPYRVSDFDKAPSSQELLIKGVFDKKNLLDIIQNFTVFEVQKQKIIKKVARYQQFRAVHKSIQRLKNNKTKQERGGVIWHTQGSGKSLTMIFFAGKIRRDTELKKYKLVFIVDRTQLERQLSNTFLNCQEETVLKAKSTSHFKKLLKKDSSDIVLGMIHKMGENGFAVAEELNPSEKIVICIDEAHRTQYGGLGANLNLALPNAPKIAFTGTPLIKSKKTSNEFGAYIDCYTIEEAVKDGATVKIIYEGRESNTKVTGESLDRLFDFYFADMSEEDKTEIKRKFGKEIAVLEAPKRIEMICHDIVKHYNTTIQPNGFKGQIVTASRKAAVRYKEALDKIPDAPDSAVIISGSHNDDPMFHPYTEESTQKKQIEQFLKPMDKHELSILIVKDMLLTGFDAPVEQVMYLDRRLTDHTLLQAIARVNRTAEGKKCGYIVDYYGLSDYLQEALNDFSSTDVKGCLNPLKDELPKLERRHQRVMNHFRNTDKNDYEACVAILEDEEKRQIFKSDLRLFLQSMEIVLPDKSAAKFVPDMKWLGEINKRAVNRFRDENLAVKGCGEKVQQLIDEHVYSVGIDPKIPPIDLLSPNFAQHVNSMKSKKAQASEIEHAIKHHITINLEQDPEYYKSLSERLKKIIDHYHDNWDALVEQLNIFRDNVESDRHKKSNDLGLSTTELAFFNILQAETVEPNVLKEPTHWEQEELAEAASQVAAMIQESSIIVGFFNKPDEMKRIRRDLKRLLMDTPIWDKLNNPKHAIERFIDLAKVHFS